ncbi:TPA: hypothetical protein PMB08_003440 [Vibrio cholerae]|nr:hypothetical protein [Vibrio cholerae]HDI3276101.1 hypothetical protein [Vibrio cholerae]
MNNPAEKMLLVALQLRDHRYSQTKIRNIWQEVLDVKDGSTSDLYREIAAIFDLPEFIREALNAIDYPVETLEPPLKKLDHLFDNLEFNSLGSIFIQQISDDVIRSLEQAKWIIDHPNFSKFSASELTTLNELCDELKTLFESISDIENLDVELKEFLDIYIAQLISGIEEYLTTNNVQSLKIAATSAFSVLGLERSILDAAQTTQEGVIFRTVLFKILDFIGYGNDIKQLADNLQLLTG